jgi:hypothetical protein
MRFSVRTNCNIFCAMANNPSAQPRRERMALIAPFDLGESRPHRRNRVEMETNLSRLCRMLTVYVKNLGLTSKKQRIGHVC